VRLVRECLGCACPDDVFANVDAHRDLRVGEVPVSWRVAVGGRLLVYVLETGGGEDLGPLLLTLVPAALAERDRGGYNRLRLVLVGDGPDLVRAGELAVEAAGLADPRLHVHALTRAALGAPCG
jgi:hypothetical protein